MNILFVTDDNLLSSVVYDIHILAEGLSLRGHRVCVIDSQRGESARWRTDEVNMARVYPKARVSLIRAGVVSTPKVGVFLGIFNSYRIIRRVIKERKIDVIVLYSVLVTGLPAVSLARKFKIPVVFRNIDMLYRLTPTLIQQKIVRFFEKMVYRRADKLLAISPKYAEYLEGLGAEKSKIDMLLSPIDIDLFHPDVDCSQLRKRWNIKKDDDVIVLVGYLYKFNALTDFIRQFPGILKKVPRVKLIIVGDGVLRPKLEQVISELSLKEKVLITGMEPFQSMPQYINLAKICINTYPITGDMKDIFCSKVIQYLSCGKATVSSSLPGMTSMLEGESCGIVYADDAIDMANEVVSLFKSPERRKRLGQAGFNYVNQVHSIDKVIFQFEVSLTQTVLQNKELTG